MKHYFLHIPRNYPCEPAVVVSACTLASTHPNMEMAVELNATVSCEIIDNSLLLGGGELVVSETVTVVKPSTCQWKITHSTIFEHHKLDFKDYKKKGLKVV